jgi:enoyl-CoA hydratase/carnithine racemase
MSLKTLKLEELEDGKIIRITIDRPQRLNAMNEDFFTEIRDAFR